MQRDLETLKGALWAAFEATQGVYKEASGLRDHGISPKVEAAKALGLLATAIIQAETEQRVRDESGKQGPTLIAKEAKVG